MMLALLWVFVLVVIIIGLVSATMTGKSSGAMINQVVTPGSKTFRANPAITIGTYTSGTIVGGTQVISGAVGSNLGALLESICLKCKSNITPALVLYFLDTAPTGTYADNTTLTWNAADFPNIIHTQVVATGDWQAMASQQTTDYGGLGKAFMLTTPNLYIVPVANGSFTPTGAADLIFDYNIMQES